PGHYRWNTLGAPGRHGTGVAGKGLGAVCCIVTLGAQPGNVTNGSNARRVEWRQGTCQPAPGLGWKRAGFTFARVDLASLGLSCDKNQRHWTPILCYVTAVAANGSQAG
ncbi:MAG: hypothetical protein WCL11_29935, partial [Verrucomicrobiota bacterium]